MVYMTIGPHSPQKALPDASGDDVDPEEEPELFMKRDVCTLRIQSNYPPGKPAAHNVGSFVCI